MEKLKKRREIIDRAALQDALAAVVETARQTRQSDQDRRPALLACFRGGLCFPPMAKASMMPTTITAPIPMPA